MADLMGIMKIAVINHRMGRGGDTCDSFGFLDKLICVVVTVLVVKNERTAGGSINDYTANITTRKYQKLSGKLRQSLR